MVMNKTVKSKTKVPARKAAASKKTTKLPVKETGNGHNDTEEPSSENGENIADAVEVAANGNEENLNGNHQESNDDDLDAAKAIKLQKKTIATTKTQTVNTKEDKSTLPQPKAKGRQKKEKENKMETEAVEATTESNTEPAVAVGRSKRKASEEIENTEQDGSEEVAGPSTLPSKSRKKRLEPAPKAASKTKSQISSEKRSAPIPKTKAKRQKVTLDIPPVKAISGKVFVIGENDVGQLGLEDVEMKKRPALLDLPHNFVDIAAGGMHSVCLTEGGEVITFGCNDEGALGRITADDSLEGKPLKVEIPERVVQISAGDSHSAALTESGHVYLWGNFRSGDGPMGLTVDGVKQPTPVRILNDVTIVKISSGTEHLACLSNDGLLYTLGCGENGQLGRIPKHSCHNGGRKGLASLLKPAQVHVGNKHVPIEDVWTGSYNTFIKAQDTGSIYAFGLNNYQQLGCERQNDEDNFKYTPKHITSFSNNTWLRITGGQHHSLALDSEGLVYSLGRADYGRLGLGEACEEKSVPTVIPTLQNEKCTDISCGNCVSFGLTEEGSIFSWGFGENHQLGHGNDEDCHIPKCIEGNFLNSWKAHKVSGGGQHTLILAVPKEDPKSDKKK